MPLGGSIFNIASSDAVAPFAPKTNHVDEEQVAEAVLRFVSSRIAEHFGQKAVLARNAIWFCFDLKTLHDEMNKAGGYKNENTLQGTKLAGDFFNTIASIPKLDGAAGMATAFYFFADVGDHAYQGNGTFTLDDLMNYVPLNAEDNTCLEFKNMAGEILKKMGEASSERFLGKRLNC